MPLSLCTDCGAALASGEPSCCSRPRLMAISPLSAYYERQLWWSRRMQRRRLELQHYIGNPELSMSVLARNARDRKLRFDVVNFGDVAHRKLHIPRWWHWTIYMGYAVAGRMVANSAISSKAFG